MGVWIETSCSTPIFIERSVTPFVGVWIETDKIFDLSKSYGVTPFVGVWIETLVQSYNS